MMARIDLTFDIDMVCTPMTTISQHFELFSQLLDLVFFEPQETRYRSHS